MPSLKSERRRGFNPRSPRPRGATSTPTTTPSTSRCFNPRSPRPRGATRPPRHRAVPRGAVSTHAPLGLGERRALACYRGHGLRGFNPRSPRPRGATALDLRHKLRRQFQPTLPSASGSDARKAGLLARLEGVSTHAPLGLGERPRPRARPAPQTGRCFNPRSPRPRGATRRGWMEYVDAIMFQPTLPSASGSDEREPSRELLRERVSTHAPLGLGERQQLMLSYYLSFRGFQPTLPSASGSDILR